jgi:hypothetical protein
MFSDHQLKYLEPELLQHFSLEGLLIFKEMNGNIKDKKIINKEKNF